MNCVHCGSTQTVVVDTGSGATETVRKRKCLNCGKSFFTSEKVIEKKGAYALLEKHKRGLKDD